MSDGRSCACNRKTNELESATIEKQKKLGVYQPRDERAWILKKLNLVAKKMRMCNKERIYKKNEGIWT